MKLSVEDVTRLSRTTIQALAQTHVIVPKEEFAQIISENLVAAEAEMWDLIIGHYDLAREELTEHLSKERLSGYDLGRKLLARMRDVSVGELTRVHEENPTKI
jgi:hypothetical protein